MDGLIGTVEDNSSLHRSTSRSGEVVLSTTTTGGSTVRTLPTVDVGDQFVGASGQDLEQVEFTTAGFPARTAGVTVLQSTWDLGIQHPNSWHILVVTTARVGRHGELEDKDLVLTTETVIGRDIFSVVTTVVTATLGTREDHEFIVGLDGDIA